MSRTHGRSQAARRDPTEGADAFPEIKFDPEGPCDEARSVIETGAPWAMEIGTGNGVFLVAEAAAHPDWRYLGIEQDAEFFYKMKRRVLLEGLRNVRCIRARVEIVLDRLIGSEKLTEVILNFSDPWPKRKHRARRVFGPEFLERLERTIVPGGEVRFTTDVGWYFNLAVADARRRAGWTVVKAGPVRDESPEPRVETNFERKGRNAGREIWSFTLRREIGPGFKTENRG